MKMYRKNHPNITWAIDHMLLIYISLIVSIILPLVITEVFFK